MTGQYWLTNEQVERLRPHFAQGSGEAQGRRPPGAEWHSPRSAQRAQVAGCAAGPWAAQDASHNRFVRWSRLGVFARIFRDLARPGSEGETLMMDSPHLKAHRTAASLRKGGSALARSVARRAA